MEERISQLEQQLNALVQEYFLDEEALGDNAAIVLLENGELSLESDADDFDSAKAGVSVMELVTMTPEGKWIPDADAIADVAAQLADA